VKGVANVVNGDKVISLIKGESTYIPVGTRHSLENTMQEYLEIIEIQSGSYLGEDDIVRLEDSYGRK
jgi:mannose-6-phosphate isomerase-like protein (cupin superfamily)